MTRADKRPCVENGCDGARKARGLCNKHYLQLCRSGLRMPLRPPTFEQKFWGRMKESPKGCWEWQGPTHLGYGHIWVGDVNWGTHRLSYTLLIADIPEGLHIDHLCRNRACANPWHMDPVPIEVNVMRGIGFGATNAGKTHCSKGHEFTPENTYERKDRRGRACRTCTAIRQGRWTGAAI